MLQWAIDPSDHGARKDSLSTRDFPIQEIDVPRPGAGDVWVYWQCHGREDVSRVRNMSMGGLFIETPAPRAEGVLTRLHFLVQEGQIRADAVVRHAKSGVGLGLRFTALSEQDRPKLATLLTRLRRTNHSSEKS